jgi:catechol-2,3-dioxygenase
MIEELGHAGLWVDDLPTMRAFYEDVLGLHVTDEDHRVGMVFLSSRPSVEHHELVLACGRDAQRSARVLNQLSWRVSSLDALLTLHARFTERSVPVRQTVSHGNAIGIYFEDPEGNVNEVYWPTKRDVPQPYRKAIDLNRSASEVLREVHRLLEDEPSSYERA